MSLPVQRNQAADTTSTCSNASVLRREEVGSKVIDPANRAMAVGYAAWAHSVQDVADHYRVDLQDGLTEDQVTVAREQHGRNELEKQPGKPLWKLVLEQFDDMLVKVCSRRQLLCALLPTLLHHPCDLTLYAQVLLLAALVSFALAYFEEGSAEEGIRAYIEPFVILLILVLNAIVGVWQESNAEAALEALTELQSEHASVTRQGKQVGMLT